MTLAQLLAQEKSDQIKAANLKSGRNKRKDSKMYAQ